MVESRSLLIMHFFRHHVPFYTFILHNLNYLFLSCNSSFNFVVYCCVGRDFKAKLISIIGDCFGGGNGDGGGGNGRNGNKNNNNSRYAVDTV